MFSHDEVLALVFCRAGTLDVPSVLVEADGGQVQGEAAVSHKFGQGSVPHVRDEVFARWRGRGHYERSHGSAQDQPVCA